jgi:hypothetical protein
MRPPVWQSTRGGKMGGKINILNAKSFLYLILYSFRAVISHISFLLSLPTTANIVQWLVMNSNNKKFISK